MTESTEKKRKKPKSAKGPDGGAVAESSGRDPSQPEFLVARRNFGLAAVVLAVGIALSATGETTLSPYVSVGALLLGIWSVHKLGRSGVAQQ